ncbi:MAG: MipA/OmpV family protein [Rhodomicrobium sp.]
MEREPQICLLLICATIGASNPVAAVDLASPTSLPPSAWILDIGGYGVIEPVYEGSRNYTFAFKPQIDAREAGDREWLTFPNDAVSYALLETGNFRAGPAGTLTLQSPYHGQDIDLRLGKANVDLAGGVFAEYYPMPSIRTRAELLQGITGNTGFAANLSADYIWRPDASWTLTLGPRAQVADVPYASQFFSTRNAMQTGFYLPYKAEGGLLYAGAELTGKYDWTSRFSTKFFLDYDQLVGDAADNPRVSLRGSSDQFIAGVGASYKVAIDP